VGKAALDGLPGLKKVKRGWHNRREINTVTYDPMKISVAEMIAHLKTAGTFAGVVE
jgi:hypothetical protein